MKKFIIKGRKFVVTCYEQEYEVEAETKEKAKANINDYGVWPSKLLSEHKKWTEYDEGEFEYTSIEEVKTN